MGHIRLDALLEEFEREMLIGLAELPAPGLAAAALVGDEIVWRHAVGRKSFDPDVPLSPDHIFRVGSITKLFTAHAVMLLAEEGRLSLDDPVHKHVPEFDPPGPTVTLRHVLCHGSGITSDGGLGIWESAEYPTVAESASRSASTGRPCRRCAS